MTLFVKSTKSPNMKFQMKDSSPLHWQISPYCKSRLCQPTEKDLDRFAFWNTAHDHLHSNMKGGTDKFDVAIFSITTSYLHQCIYLNDSGEIYDFLHLCINFFHGFVQDGTFHHGFVCVSLGDYSICWNYLRWDKRLR